MNSDQVWSIIGKILALIGGVAAVIKIIEWISSPRHKLVATMQNVPFSSPPPANKKQENFYDLPQSMWIVSIRNKGKKPCEEITLALPNAELACISREGTSKERRELKHGVIALGTLNPMETISIEAWGREWHPSIHTIRLSHNSGLGKLRILLPARKIFHDLDEMLASPLELLILTSIILLLVFMGINLAKKSTKHEGLDSHITNSVPSSNSSPPTNINVAP